MKSNEGMGINKNLNIGIITYQAPHRKTQDIISKLLFYGFRNLKLIAIPWVQRANFQPMYKHRPSNCTPLDAKELAQNLNLAYISVLTEQLNSTFLQEKFDHILIAGAGILPQECASEHKIINAHPGFLPTTKGLDALKWSIIHGNPIGVTTHYISPETDEGLLIERREVLLEKVDSFYQIAIKQYELEIEMMINSIFLLERKEAPLSSLKSESSIPNRRMPLKIEQRLLSQLQILLGNL